ncbi:MAG: cobalamin-dependent protein [Candidatus Omnitrophica bacterium]|nr:cobalamin-dependent protein [Candidatus Omnitrophota bacterium]
MNVLLIVPPIQDSFFTIKRNFPLGILYLATVLKEEGIKVKLLNSLEENKKFSLTFPKEFNYLKRYYKSNKLPFSLFQGFFHFGLTYEEISNVVRAYNPQIVGISANFSPYFFSALEVARRVKEINKNITVVVGGRVATEFPEFVLGYLYIDFAIRGEGEFALSKLCKGLAKGSLGRIGGLCYRVNNKIKISSQIQIIKDLDGLPLVDRRLFNYRNYKFNGLISTAIIASRGCYLGCRFCSIKEPFRARSVEKILEEMKSAYSLGIRHFNFEDDNINLHPQKEKLVDLIISHFSNRNEKIKVSFMNGIMAKGLSKRLIDKLLMCGLTHIDFSLVSSNKRLRLYLGRREENKIMISKTNYLAQKGVPVTIHFITGFPSQKFRDALKDIIYLSKQRAFLGISIFYPVLGKGLLNEQANLDYIKNNIIFFRSSFAYFDRDISRDRIFFLFYIARIVNFVKLIIDIYNLNNENFYPFIYKFKNSNLNKSYIISDKKIDRITLGIMALNKILEERTIFRAISRKDKDKFVYQFIKEDFISPKDLNLLFKNKLKIRGVKTNNYIFLG